MANTSSSSVTSEAKDSRWYFTAVQLANSPSQRHGIDADQELSYRQLTAYLIQEMGQRLQVSQLCINTAIVYMHRFYAFHSFTHFHRNGIAAASLFLAAKVEEQPRKLEHVIKVAHLCLNEEAPHPSTDLYAEQAQDLVFNENVLLQTLGFDVAIDHPHTHVVKTCNLVKACKDLAQTSYFLASNSLHLTPMCLQYRPTVVACFCIYLACKWSRWEIPQSTEGKHWFHYVDKSVTMDLLKQLTDEFIAIYEKSPARLKSKLNSIKALAQGARISEPSRPISESSANANCQLSQLEPIRRPESHSSHHRTHHSSSSSHPGASHHHHSKQLPPNEIGDHVAAKVSSHKQPYPATVNSNHSSRSRIERSQVQNDPQHNIPAHSSKQLPQITNQRPNSSSRPSHGIPTPSTSTSQRVPHDTNYHKNRNTTTTQVNPQVSGHKTMPKTIDSQRNANSGRSADPNKVSSKHSTNNLYNMQNPLNTGLDMSRNITQSSSNIPPLQRQFLPGYNTQPPNYNQAISNRNTSTNIKYEQSVQQQVHLQPMQKQSVESSYTLNSRQLDEVLKSGEQLEVCSPPKYGYLQMQQQTISMQQQQLQQQQQSKSSIFSPEWNEKATPSNISNTNSNSNGNNSNKPIGLNIKSNRDSPKKPDRERRSETPKKEKIRNENLGQDQIKMSQIDKRSGITKKLPEPPNIGNPQNTAANIQFEMKNQQHNVLNLSGVKRQLHTSESGIKMEDDNISREHKIRKLESQSPPKIVDHRVNMPYMYDQQLNTDSRSMKSFPPTINGIETNPDLVSSLLKESLCNDSKFATAALIKNETLELTEVIEPTVQMSIHHNLPSDLPSTDESKLFNDEFSKSKTEKKKKKDKHKHKEKDKSKDKEEKKKHKKDKDRHKDRDRSSGTETEPNPFKIKISKDKLNLPLLEASHPPISDLKLKIPKDKIKGEITNYQVDENAQSTVPPSSGLKIKISKDKIENYNNQHQSSSGGGSSSSKKKDRDREREREKEKKRNSNNEHNKQNGNGNNSSSGISGSSNKNQSSSKMQQFNQNMNQLFGETNDDESPSPRQKTIPHQLSRYEYRH